MAIGPENPTRVLIVAGEASGDAHAARLVSALREALPEREFEFFGAAGPQMRGAGVEAVVETDDFSIVGVPEIIRALPMFWGAFKKLKQAARVRKPDVAVLVDFPEFNLKLAKSLKKLGFRVVYYISPQLWAWRKYRARTIRRHVDLLISILPFEPDWYNKQGIGHVVFGGNPTVAEMHEPVPRESFLAKHGFDIDRPVVALLPGSRHKEVVRILPRLLRTAELMKRSEPRMQFVVAMSALRAGGEFSAAIESSGVDRTLLGEDLKVVFGETIDALGASEVAAVTSGTATLETAVVGTPMAIVYCSSALNYLLLRPLISVDHIGLVNLIAGRRMAKELLQDEFTPEALAGELFRLLEPETNRLMRGELAEVTQSLEGESASKNAAASIADLLEKH